MALSKEIVQEVFSEMKNEILTDQNNLETPLGRSRNTYLERIDENTKEIEKQQKLTAQQEVAFSALQIENNNL